MNDPGVGGECSQLPRHAVVKPHAQRDQQVGLGQAHIGGIASVHARHTHEIRIVSRQFPQAHERAYRGGVEQTDELAQLLGRAGRNNSAPGVDQRAGRTPTSFPRPWR